MRFFDRKCEIEKLREIRNVSHKSAQFTVLTGRRRIGKTSLVMKAYEDETILYFFVTRSTESVLCEEFVEELTSKLHVPILGKVDRFADIFDYVMELSKSRPLTCKTYFLLLIYFIIPVYICFYDPLHHYHQLQ